MADASVMMTINVPRAVKHVARDTIARRSLPKKARPPMAPTAHPMTEAASQTDQAAQEGVRGALRLDYATSGVGEHWPLAHRYQQGERAAPPKLTFPLPWGVVSRLPMWALCPITHAPMIDPVFTTDGHTYERAAVAQWLKQRLTSPMTGQ
eukprot:2197585-Prymnesium_polylepis.1